MPWWQKMIPIPESLKKHVVCYLLERYFGRFMAEKLSLDQLKLHLWQGNGTVEKIKLYIQALNEICEEQNLALEFVDGYIGELHVTIPWGSILRDRCMLEVRGLRIIVKPRRRHESATSVIESMWNSMTSSAQLSVECAKEDASKAIHAKQTYEGEDLFSQTIESIMGKVKIKLIDTVIQFEHVPKNSPRGVGLLLEIDSIDYFDESSNTSSKEETTKSTNDESKMDAQFYRTKKFIIEGVNLSTVEFSSEFPSFSRSTYLTQSQQENENDDSMSENCDLDESNSSHTSEDAKETETLGQEEFDAVPGLNGQRHVIKIGQFSKSQEVHISLKQSETFDGPKVWIHLDLKFLIMFLSPRQLNVLIELAKGWASPDIEDTKSVPSMLKCVPKPMSGSDYQRVEQELQRQIQPLSNLQSTGLQGVHGWSSPSFDDSYTEENFLPMEDSTMSESFMSGVYRSMDSSISSNMTTSTSVTCRARKAKCSGSDPNADSHFHVECESVALVLLHEDLLIPSCERGQLLVPSSVQEMQHTVEEFFGNIGCFVHNPEVDTHFEDTKIVVDKSCSLNNFRLLIAGLNMGNDEKTTKSTYNVSGRATVTKLEVVECLFDSPKRPVEIVSILRFFENDPSDKKNVDSSKHNIDVHFRHVKNISKYTTRRNSEPKTDISVLLNKCELDFDISIIDRLTAFLEPTDSCPAEKSKGKTSTGTVPDSVVGSRTDLRISSPRLDIKLRFPIPDFRPALDSNRIPWWQKNVRSDYLSLVLTDIQFKSTFQTFQTVKEYEIQSKGLHIYYMESENSSPLQIAKCEFDNGLGSVKNVYKNRLCIRISPHEFDDLEEPNEPQRDPMTTSMYDAFENQTCAQPGPFNAKKVVHQSDTPHFRMQEDAPELIIPGDKPEIDEFIRSTISYSRIQLEVFIPMISMRFPSKHLYEVIYNRINNDLLLWKPCAPQPRASVYEDEFCTSFNPAGKNIVHGDETFFAMSNGMHESDSGSGDEFETSVNLTRNRAPSQFVLNVQIAQGLLIINPPARDSSTNVIPGQQGEFLLNLGDAKVFVVSGYEGDDTLGYVCVQLHDAHLYHSEMMPTPNMIGPMKEFGSTVEKHLNSTLHKSETGMLANASQSGGSREMITVAVKIQGSHETHHVKTVQVSIGLNKVTLKHRVCQGSNSWVSHMLDFFNVQDYPIPNYRCKEVLSEIHLHLWDCAIDYRPKYLPVRSVVTIGTFSLTSQLSVKADSPTLRFIFEECGLFLSDRSPPKSGVVSSAPVDLKKDYVNVIDLGIFEISLRTNDKVSPSYRMDDEEKEEQPLTDLRASNNVLNIHTCSDSGKMLMQLLIYFASDGDLSSPASKESPFDSPRHQVEQELIVLEPQSMSTLSKSQHEHINTLLGEAMIESKIVPVPEKTSYQPCTNMFYFPGESQLEDLTVNSFPQVTSDLGDVNYFTNRYSEPDDDFCFIEDGPGLGRFPKNGLPEINFLTSERIHIIEDHFRVPTSKGDVFQRPKSFPCPLTRYTLCDMTVVWNMYGGNDFQLTETEKPKKTVNFSASNSSGSVSFSNARQSEVTINDKVVDKKTANLTWMRKGGVNRDHKFHMELHLNKIRFQHEVYPETTTQASRQVLIISDIEIIDRLESSEINKFLYQYSSQARPKQSQAHMIVIKALHVRPDPKLLRQECCLKISMLPLRFNIDQDSLLFLIRFFTELSNGPVNSDDQEELACFSKNNTPTHQPPVMAIGDDYDKQITKQARQVVDENLIILMEESKIQQDFDTVSVSSTGSATDGSPVYFRKVIFSPDVLIKLDYHGKRVDMTHGSLPGLLLGLGHLNCSELRLKRLKYRKGLLGNDKLINYLMKEWLNDIKKNQLPSILGGVGPMHSLVQLFQGVRDLFWLPIEQYQKDGRIIRGLQRGANSFTTSTATAALELTSRLIHLIQITAETAYDMLSPGPSVRRVAKSKGKRRRHHNPQDIREGMANAITVVREGFGETANNIVKVATLEKEQKGYSGAVGGVLRQIPPTMLKPIIIASEATGNVLGGMRCQLVPDARQEDRQKWRTDDR